jgi:SAM-dependent methyltransferase
VRLETSKYWPENIVDEDIEKYRKIQIKRHLSKYEYGDSGVERKRSKNLYWNIFKNSVPFFHNQMKDALCLGTRNNHERDCFQEFFNMKQKEVKVFSLDLSNRSGADFIMDFNSLPEEWECKWDFIFSNSIDHCLSATETFYEWYRVLRPHGVMLLSFDLWKGSEGKPIASDCCLFTKQSVDSFFEIFESNKPDTVKDRFIGKWVSNDNYNIVLTKS